MTDAVGTNPALASLVLATPGGAANPGVSGPPAAGDEGSARPEGQAASFDTLLLGLQTPATGSSPPVTLPGTSGIGVQAGADATGLTGSETSPQTLATLAGMAGPTGPTGKDSGKTSGEDSPDSGEDLPLADDPALLASLAGADGSLANPAVALALQTPAAMASALGIAEDPGAAAVTLQAGGAVRQALSAQQDRPALAQLTPGEAIPGTLPAIDTTPGMPGSSDVARGLDPGQAGDFRARLEAALADAGRAAVADHDAGTNPSGLAITAGPAAVATAHTPSTTSASATALPDSLPALQPMADREAWAQGLGERLLLMADKGLQSATLRLQPEHLGPMEIRIQVDEDGSAQVLFSAHHGQTRDALESTLPRLRELLAEQGLSLTQANIDAGRSGSFAQRGFSSGGSPAQPRDNTEPGPAAVETPSQWVPLRSSMRRLDVMV